MTMRALIGICALAMLLGGCAIDDSGPVRSVYRPASGASSKGSVVYLTDRQRDRNMPGGFDNAWGDGAACGVANIVLPPARLSGEEEKWGYIEKTDGFACAGTGGPLSGLIERIKAEAASKHCNTVLLFVHGFHTGFDGSVLRAGQLAHDTQTACVAAAFAWTSEVKLDRYAVDLERSAYAQPLLAAFLRELADSGLKVKVVAHSMGARIALGALSGFKHARNPPRPGFIDQLVLAAPDIGIAASDNDFAKLIADAAPYAKRITVYASGNDTVMAVSKSAHGGVARAGGDPAAGYAHVDLIDASDPPADLLDHSYYGMAYEALYDMTMALHGVSPDDRLKPNGLWPATLVRKDGRLALVTMRDQRSITKIMIFLAPLLPF